MNWGKITLNEEKSIREYLSQFEDEKSYANILLKYQRTLINKLKQEDPKRWDKIVGIEGSKTICQLIRNFPPAFRKTKTLEFRDKQGTIIRTVSTGQLYLDFGEYIRQNTDIELKPMILFNQAAQKGRFYKPKFDIIEYYLLMFHDFLKQEYKIDEKTLREWFFTS